MPSPSVNASPTLQARLVGDVRAESALAQQQTGESDAGSELATEMVEEALVANLRTELEAVSSAEARIRAHTCGLSVGSGVAIPDERLESEPLAERTIEEQQGSSDGAR